MVILLTMEVVIINRNIWTKVGNFLLGNGFYIALTLCVTLIGLSGYYLMDAVTPTVIAPVTSSVVLPDPTVPVSPPVVLPKEEEKEVPEVSPTLEEQAPPEDLTPAPQEEAPPQPTGAVIFTWPSNGAVVMHHSLEVLAYDPVMGDWRTHVGLDIASEVDAPVLSTSSGTVTAVFSDDWTGTTVVIAHQNLVESTYGNLTAEPVVAVGDVVTPGQVIGSVGVTAMGETEASPHLQFSMTCDGVAVNPLDYLPDRY